jgi:adenosylcobinamide-GDP ribazoletransferase
MNRARQELHAMAAAVMFFTRLPVPAGWGETRADLQRAAAYFPLVGWLVGAWAAAVWWLARLEWGPAIAAGLSLAATLLLTGAMHEDGFADACDGFGGGYTRERVLEIMRDSRIGAFGAIGVVMMLGLKWQVVAALPAALAPGLLICGHVASRAVSTSVMASLVYVREDAAKAKPLATELSGGRLALVVVTAVAAFALLPPRLWWTALVLLLVRAVLVRWLRYRLGGYTGDCLGAVQQVSELAFYLTAVALA